MTINILFVLAICSELVNGLAYEAPRATGFEQGWEFNGLGWSPAPTSPPTSQHELIKRGHLEGRQLASTILAGADQTCGYLSGSAGAVYTCGDPTSTCNLLPATASNVYGAIACCARGQCYGRLFCINSADYSASCNDVCQANTFTLKCTYSNAPYCNTAVWANPRVSDVYCAASSVSTPQTIYTTFSGQTIGGKFTPLALDASSILTTSSRTTRSTDPSTSTTTRTSSSETPTLPITPTPVPAPDGGSSTPVGAIVGGVVGGVALLAAIAFGIFFVRRKNRKDKTAAAGVPATTGDNHNSQPPPVYIPPQSEMDGSAANKHPMTQGYYPPGAGAGESGNQYQKQSDTVSNAGYGTYDSNRRESTLSPISPQTQQGGSVAGSPHMSESYVAPGHGSYHAPPPGAHEIGYGAPPTTYEMAGTPIHR